jgi:hypothetical protein
MQTFKHKNNGSTMTYKDGCMKIENLVIEGEPNLDYWEEVIQKDWKILSFKNKHNNQIYTEFENGWDYKNSDFCFIPYNSCLRYYSILSAKNLKTGVIFTVGDKVLRHADEMCSDPCKEVRLIDKLYFKDNTLHFDTIDSKNFTLSLFSKVETPLFTTFDGEDIFEYTDREFAWVINGDYKYMLSVSEINNRLSLPDTEIYKVFSTKENAEKWVKENTKQPLFISEDGVEIFEGDRVYFVNRNLHLCTVLSYLWMPDSRKYFAEKEEAEEYLLMSNRLLSINDIVDLQNKNSNGDFKGSLMYQRLVSFVKTRV